MQAPRPLDGSEHHPTLAEELRGAAQLAASAANLADGEYLPQMDRDRELACAWRDASRASAALQQIAVRVARLDGAEVGMRLLHSAILQLDAGRAPLGDVLAIDEDAVRGAAVVLEPAMRGSSSWLLREAADLIDALADLALLESLSPDAVFRGLVERG